MDSKALDPSQPTSRPRRSRQRTVTERLRRLYPDVHTPAISTVHAILDRNGLVERGPKRRRNKATGTQRQHVELPNQLWCADYKGEFMLADRRYCYPLTITDYASRFVIACDALPTTKERFAITVFERAFKDFGLPDTIRSDNGVPFASPNSLFNLSKLSVWWLRLGINIERIEPGCPQQNGRHERMHLTLKKEATRPAGENFLQQQDMFDAFVDRFNRERPHQGINMQTPAELYRPSDRPYRGLVDLDYPLHDRTATIITCGRICIGKLKVNVSQVFAGQKVGVKEVADRIWMVSFMVSVCSRLRPQPLVDLRRIS